MQGSPYPPPWPTSQPTPVRLPHLRNPNARWRVIARNVFPFVVVLGLWEIVARAGVFPPKLFPSLVTVAETFVRLTANGILPHHTFDTILRLFAGFALAAIVGVVLGILMGRSRRVEDIALPLVSIGAPIPGSPMRRCSCSGSGSATPRRCCWSPSCRPSRSSSTPGPA